MINATASIQKTRLEVVRFQIGHLIQNLRGIEARGKKVENVPDADTHPAHARTASALLRINGDAVEQHRDSGFIPPLTAC